MSFVFGQPNGIGITVGGGGGGGVGPPGPAGPGVPTGGTANQALTKIDGTDYNTQWVTIPALTDGDKGDITVSSSGSVWSIDAGVVTFAKMQTVSVDVLLGNDSSGTAVQEIPCTAAGRALLDDADATAQRSTLGLGTLATQSGTFSGTSSGTNTGDQTSIVGITGTISQFNTACTDADFATVAGVAAGYQPLDATLTAFAALTIAANSLSIGTGADAFSQTTFGANTFPARASTGSLEAKTITDFGLSLADDADASTARTTLGLGTLATQSGTFSGTSSGTNTGDQNLFGTIAVSGQSDVVADSTSDTLTLAAGSNVTITTDAGTDTITISASTGGISDGDKGDITVSSGGTVWTIDAGVVTFAKMQAVSANVLLGNDATGTTVEEITCTAAGRAILDDADASAQRTTLGLGTLATQSGTFSGTSSGTNTGDQTSIVGITGTIAQFNTACTDANFQPEDATLTAFAALTIAAESLTIGTGADAFTQTTFAANTFPARASTGSLVAKSITDFGLSLVDDSSAAAARATLGLSEFDWNFFYPTVADGTIAVAAKTSFAGTINQIRGLDLASGTCTVAIQINGTNVTGLSGLSVTTTAQDATASAANTFAAGDRITCVITSNSSGSGLEFSLKYTR